MSYTTHTGDRPGLHRSQLGQECNQCGDSYFAIVIERGVPRTDTCGCRVEVVDPEDEEVDRGEGPITDGGSRWEAGHAAARRAEQHDREPRADGGQTLHPDVDEEDVVEGERIAVSHLTGIVYLVTRWVEVDDEGRIRSLRKEELTDEEIQELPEESRNWIEEQLTGFEERDRQ